MLAKVSVIVPIYNVEKYIEKCVTSIMNQTYSNIEIILVDDGSPDKSSIIIDNLKQKDRRIVCIHKKNGGVSSARNVGLEVATGEYIMFVDGDDWIERDCISYFVGLIGNNDIAFNKNQISDFNQKSSNNVSIRSSEEMIEGIYTGKIDVAVWNKIYNRSFLTTNNIRFNEKIWFGEGMLFNINCLQFVEYVVLGEKGVYHQVSNPNSAMRKFNVESLLCGIRSLDVQKSIWKKENKKIKYAWEHQRRSYNWGIMCGLVQSGLENQYYDLFLECASNLKKGLYKTLRADIPFKEKVKYMVLSICPLYMANRLKGRRYYNEE